MPTVNEVLRPYVGQRFIAGAVTLVADKKRILSLDAIGFSDIAAQKKMSTDSVFWIASQTKPMTASLIMMLIDEGKVHLDDARRRAVFHRGRCVPVLSDDVKWWRL